MQSNTTAITIKTKAILERLDDVLIAEMITQRFHGPFIGAEELIARLDTVASTKNAYVSRRVSSARGK